MADKRITVFCSASNSVLPKYKKLAYKLGESIAKQDNILVYGGGEHGLMGEVAKGAIDNDGRFVGVITSHLVGKESKSGNTITHIVPTMAERKEFIFEQSDFVVVLPGGCGTMDELFEAMTMRIIGERTHPIYILDTKDHKFSESIRQLIDMMVEMGTLAKRDRDCVTYVDSVTELERLIRKNLSKPYISALGMKIKELTK